MSPPDWLVQANDLVPCVRNFVDGNIDSIPLSVEPHKKSGQGTELGLEGLAAYTASSAVHMLM